MAKDSMDDAITYAKASKPEVNPSKNLTEAANKDNLKTITEKVKSGATVSKSQYNMWKSFGKLGVAGAIAKVVSDPTPASAAEVAISATPARSVAEAANPTKAGGGFKDNEEGELASKRNGMTMHTKSNDPKQLLPKSKDNWDAKASADEAKYRARKQISAGR